MSEEKEKNLQSHYISLLYLLDSTRDAMGLLISIFFHMQKEIRLRDENLSRQGLYRQMPRRRGRAKMSARQLLVVAGARWRSHILCCYLGYRFQLWLTFAYVHGTV